MIIQSVHFLLILILYVFVTAGQVPLDMTDQTLMKVMEVSDVEISLRFNILFIIARVD